MNEQALMGKIANHIVEGKFETDVPPAKAGKKELADLSDLIQRSLEKNVPPPLVSAEALDRAMDDSIKRFKAGEFLLPDLIFRAAYTGKSRELLAKFADDAEALTKGTAVLATIEGKDYSHWEEMVETILQGLGYEIDNLGDDLSAQDILRSVDENTPEILWINTPSTSIPEFNVKPSATLKTEIKQITENISEAGWRDQVAVMVGGIDGVYDHLPSVEELKADFRCGNVIQTISYLRELAFSAN